MQAFKSTFIRWLKKYNEYVPLLIAVLVFYLSPYALRTLDPTAGIYDVGVLQVMIWAVIAFCVFQAVVWMALKVNWLPFRKYLEIDFTDDFFNLTPWQKSKLVLSFYSVLLLSLVLLSRVL